MYLNEEHGGGDASRPEPPGDRLSPVAPLNAAGKGRSQRRRSHSVLLPTTSSEVCFRRTFTMWCCCVFIVLLFARKFAAPHWLRRFHLGEPSADHVVCELPIGSSQDVARDLVVFVTSISARKTALPVMLDSLTNGALLPSAVYVTIPTTGTLSCPPTTRTVSAADGRSVDGDDMLTIHLVRKLIDRGPVEKYVGAIPVIFSEQMVKPRFVLIIDDDHEYDPGLVQRYSEALHLNPEVAFTVQSPPEELKFVASIPIVYGSRGVGVTFDLLCDGLPEFASEAFRVEPTCRVVDDVVISIYLAARGVDVRDVPGFSFERRPWIESKWMHQQSKRNALRGPGRTRQNALCHDKLMQRIQGDPANLHIRDAIHKNTERKLKRKQRMLLNVPANSTITPVVVVNSTTSFFSVYRWWVLLRGKKSLSASSSSSQKKALRS